TRCLSDWSSDVCSSDLFLAGIAIAVVVMRWVDIYWLIAPAFFPSLQIHLMDIVLLVVIGAIWLYAFAAQLTKRALLPLHDPNFVDRKSTRLNSSHLGSS